MISLKYTNREEGASLKPPRQRGVHSGSNSAISWFSMVQPPWHQTQTILKHPWNVQLIFYHWESNLKLDECWVHLEYKRKTSFNYLRPCVLVRNETRQTRFLPFCKFRYTHMHTDILLNKNFRRLKTNISHHQTKPQSPDLLRDAGTVQPRS